MQKKNNLKNRVMEMIKKIDVTAVTVCGLGMLIVGSCMLGILLSSKPVTHDKGVDTTTMSIITRAETSATTTRETTTTPKSVVSKATATPHVTSTTESTTTTPITTTVVTTTVPTTTEPTTTTSTTTTTPEPVTEPVPIETTPAPVETTTTESSSETITETVTEAVTEPVTSDTSTTITEEVIVTEPPAPTRPSIYDCTLSEDLQNYIFNLCNEYGVEYQFIMAIIKAESGFNTGAYNAGCVGLMQLNEYYNSGTASSLGVSLYDPYGNVLVGIRHVSNLLSKYSYTDALICYNYGEYGAQGYLGGSTSYSRTVMSYYYDYIG